MSEYFPEPKSSARRVKVELDLSNYAAKADLKNVTGVDLASLKSNVNKLGIDELKDVSTNLSNLRSKVGKLDVDKFVPVPVDLKKLSDVVKKDVAKKKSSSVHSWNKKILHDKSWTLATNLNKNGINMAS